MNGYQSLPNKDVTSKNMTGKPLSIPYRSRSNSRDNRDTSRHRSPKNHHIQNQNLTLEIAILDHKVGWVHHTQDHQTSRKKPSYNNNNNYSSNSRPQSPNYNRDGNRSRRLFSHNCLRNVQNYIMSLLDQEQTDDTKFLEIF